MMIILHLILLSAVHIYDFHIFITSSSSFHRFITNQFNDLLPVGLLAYTDIAEVEGSNPYIQPEVFFRLSFRNCKIKVAYITAMIILHLILHSAVHIYDFHIFITSINY